VIRTAGQQVADVGVQYVDAQLNRARHQVALQVGPTKGRILNNIATETGDGARSVLLQRLALNGP